jgi:3-oxoacyl-[acyl-carrier-protein] synthase III
VLGTFTPDMCIPSTACLVQDKLGLDAPAMDVTAACAGFAYALITAAQLRRGRRRAGCRS